ncbi:gypsy retrotransposon integrase-like protein 1 [Plakobranchus ocellatus]|uniref:Gypsy retrotransposon integrase-like protein 1 n=1 Tax=Plakobranchus ocellatus TaxID=259542 RepID=A0AAV4AZJ9_9GAST|nr:gypsy retrotransposon integrase-like protein 1 [Plakobranchus ocellatus]
MEETGDVQSEVEDGMLKLASGKSVPVVTNCAALRDPEKTRSLGLPVSKREIGGREVDVMRDTGCEGVVVRKQLVDASQLTGGATQAAAVICDVGSPDSITGAHLGIRRTKDKVLSNFYWPGVDGNVTRYCRSCDVCQRTVKKSTVPRVPLEKVPLIDTPFKRVAIDLVGPINPPSEAGHRFILTLVDYATRFAEAVPLHKIDTESVAEPLVDIYSRLVSQRRC